MVRILLKIQSVRKKTAALWLSEEGRSQATLNTNRELEKLFFNSFLNAFVIKIILGELICF
jgi:hypothetical protein